MWSSCIHMHLLCGLTGWNQVYRFTVPQDLTISPTRRQSRTRGKYVRSHSRNYFNGIIRYSAIWILKIMNSDYWISYNNNTIKIILGVGSYKEWNPILENFENQVVEKDALRRDTAWICSSLLLLETCTVSPVLDTGLEWDEVGATAWVESITLEAMSAVQGASRWSSLKSLTSVNFVVPFGVWVEYLSLSRPCQEWPLESPGLHLHVNHTLDIDHQQCLESWDSLAWGDLAQWEELSSVSDIS